MKRIFIPVFLMMLASAGVCFAADPPAKACPDDKTLTREARIALVETQKLMGEDKYNEARKVLSAFVAEHPDKNHAYVAYTLASLHLEKGAMKKALTYYRQTVEFCPQYAPAWQNLGKVCYDLGRFKEAADALEKTYFLTGEKNHVLRFHAAVARISAKQSKKALAHLEFLTSGRAGTPEDNWVKLMVQLSMENKKSAKAVKTVERLLGKPDPKPYLFRLAASLYLDLNKYRKAAENLSAYGLLAPLTPAEETLVADLYNNLGVPAKAARHYEKVIAKKPCRKIHERLASSWFEACDPDKAIAALERGLKAHPDSHAMWKLKGWIFYETKDFDQASKAFYKAARLNKKDIKSVFMSGLCACKAGQNDTARIALKKAAGHAQYKRQAIVLIRQMDAAQGNRS